MLPVSRLLLWQCAAFCVALVAAGLWATGLTVASASTVPLLTTMLPTVLIALVRNRAAALIPLRFLDVLECLALMSLFVALGAAASYLVALGTTGWSDRQLIALDRALGFDWRAAYEFVAARPTLGWLGKLAYWSIFASPTLVLTALAWTRRAARARAFIIAHTLALAITLAIFWWFPARSALLAIVGDAPGYMPATGIGHAAVIEALRAGRLTSINLAELHGLITFPSFHAASALLVMWAVWPMRRVRVPVVAVNVAMLLATPIEGTHYLVDVIAGLCVAAVAIGSLYAAPHLMATRAPRLPVLKPA